jgi:hypothetical protein
MTKRDTQKPEEVGELTDRQKKAIPYLVASPTYEQGRKRAKVSKNCLYEWLRNPTFKEELRKQRDQIVTEALEALKGNMTRAAEVLVSLLDADSDTLKRHVANDILNHANRGRELIEIEERLTRVEKLVLEGRE